MWNSRTLIPPPTNFLPPSASSDESSWLALISTLRSIQENQELSGPLLKGEQMTLSRLLYKSKNSQHRWKVYQLLVKLNKCLERLTEVPVCSYAALMASGCKQQGRKRTVTVTVKDPALPSRQMLDYLCVSLQGCAKLSIHITGLCQQAAVIIVQTLHSGMFISNNIILLSLVSRIRVLACNFLKTAIGWYDTLLPLRSCLFAANAEWLDKETELPLTLTEWLGEEAIQLFALPESRSAATSKSDILEKLFQGDIEIDLLAGSGERWVKAPNQSRTQNDLEIDLLAESRERSVTTLVQSLIETQTPATGTDLGEKLSVAELAAIAAAANKKKGNASTANAANEAKRQARAFHLPSKKKMKKDFEGPVDQLVKSAKFMKSEALLKTKHKVKKVLSSVKRGCKLTRKQKADASTEKVGQKTKGKKRRFKGRKVPPFGIRQAGNYSRLQSGGDTLDSRTGNTWKVALDGIRPGNAMEISVEGAVRKVTRKASTSRQSKVALAFRRSLSRESAGSGGSGGIVGSKRRRRLQARIAKIQRRRSLGGGVALGGASGLDSLVISNQAAAKGNPSSVSHQHAESVMLQNAFQHGNHSHMPKEHSNLQGMKRTRQIKSDTGSKEVSGAPGNSAQPFGPSVPNPALLISRGGERIGLGMQLTKKDKMLKRLQKLKQKFIGKGKRKPGVRFVPGSPHFGNPLASPFSGEQRQGLVRQQEHQSGQRYHGSSDHQPHQQRGDQIHSHNGSFQQRQDGHHQHQRQIYQQPQNSQPPHYPPPPLLSHHLPVNRIEQHPFPHNHHHQHQQRHHHHMEQQSDARMQNSMPRPMPRRQKKSAMGDCRKPVGREKKPGGNGQASTDQEIDSIFSDLF